MWLPEDVEAAVAFLEWERSICQSCAQPLDESMDPEFAGAYETEVLVCHACAEKDRRRNANKHLPDGARIVAFLPEGRREIVRGHG